MPLICPSRWCLTGVIAAAAVLAGCATATGPYRDPEQPVIASPTVQAPAAAMPTAEAPAGSAPQTESALGQSIAQASAAPDSAASAVAPAVDPLRPGVVIDPEDRSARTDLWARVRGGFAMPDIRNELVDQHEQWYATRPDYVQRMTERGGRYLFHILEDVHKRGMPSELALLPFIESAFNPQAMSTAKASGMWQFIPSTGRHYELTQNIFRDDRRDVLASTRAALDYLAYLHDMFDDWHLALAAYNWGEGNVRRALVRNQRAGLPGNYENLRMPAETRNYVPKLQAVKNIVAAPDRFGLALPALENHPYFLGVAIERDIDVDLAASLAHMSVEEFKQLNPQMNKPVILAAGTPQVLLPYDNANAFVRNVERHRGALASWTAWVAPKTLRPAAVAGEVGMTESELREVNRIPPGMLIRAGSTLLVPRDERRKADVSPHLAENASIALAPDRPPLRRVVVKADRKGVSVAAIARRYGTSASEVARWNKVSAGGRFAAGAPVIVYVSHKPSRRAAAPAASTARKAAAARR